MHIQRTWQAGVCTNVDPIFIIASMQLGHHGCLVQFGQRGQIVGTLIKRHDVLGPLGMYSQLEQRHQHVQKRRWRTRTANTRQTYTMTASLLQCCFNDSMSVTFLQVAGACYYIIASPPPSLPPSSGMTTRPTH